MRAASAKLEDVRFVARLGALKIRERLCVVTEPIVETEEG